MPTTELLRSVPILAGLSDELLERLAAQADEVHVGAGEWLMREGDEADSLFIVQTGRLEVVDEGPPETVIRVLRRGDVLGELALLREDRARHRSAPSRDAGLLELSRSAFEELIRQAPSFALGLTRAMGAQLAASRTPLVAAIPPRTIAVVGLEPAAPVAEVADRLADALARYGPVARLRAGELATIDQAEQDGDYVVLSGSSSPTDPWTALCLREADLVVAVSAGGWTPSGIGTGRRCRAVSCSCSAPTPWIPCSRPPSRARYRWSPTRRGARPRSRRPHDGSPAVRSAWCSPAAGPGRSRTSACSRSCAPPGCGSTASPGSASARSSRRGSGRVPHRGPPPRIASNLRGPEPDPRLRAPRVLADPRGQDPQAAGEEFGEARIEELPLRFFCLSCDLIGREAVVHRLGRVVDAVYPSLAIPGVFPPRAATAGCWSTAACSTTSRSRPWPAPARGR